MPVKYDRYEPVDNTIKTTPRQGIDATAQELKQSKEPENKIKTEPKKRKCQMFYEKRGRS